MADLISDDYKRLLVSKHEGKPWGGKGHIWVPDILPLLNAFMPGPITVLDFGCGRGTLKPDLEPLHPDVTVIEYDPGVSGKDHFPPVPVDYIVCTDVMEHVEPKYVVDTLRTINWLAIQGVFFSIVTVLSASLLPDGRNTHIMLKPTKWWKDMLSMHITDMDWKIHRETIDQLVISGWRKAHVD